MLALLRKNVGKSMTETLETKHGAVSQTEKTSSSSAVRTGCIRPKRSFQALTSWEREDRILESKTTIDVSRTNVLGV